MARARRLLARIPHARGPEVPTTRVQGEPGAIDASYTRLYRWLADHALATDPDAWSLERYDQRR